MEQLRAMLYVAPVILLAVVCHEYAHGWMSDRLGDPTPRRSGRLSLNPFCHLDFWGTICLLLFHVGWAKPVPVNPLYYRNRKKGIILVALAGPITNLIIALISVFIKGILIKCVSSYLWIATVFIVLMEYSAKVNIGLTVFNLIPIPPLDGSKILGELSNRVNCLYIRWDPYWKFILLILLATGILGMPVLEVVEVIFLSEGSRFKNKHASHMGICSGNYRGKSGRSNWDADWCSICFSSLYTVKRGNRETRETEM